MGIDVEGTLGARMELGASWSCGVQDGGTTLLPFFLLNDLLCQDGVTTCCLALLFTFFRKTSHTKMNKFESHASQ